MSGETEGNVSGWTVDTLHSHLQRQLNDLRELLHERYETQTRAVDAAFAAAEKAIGARQDHADREFHEHLQQVRTETAAALAAAEKAIAKAESATDKRFESVNEFRSTLSDQAAQFITRDEAKAAIARNEERVQELLDRFNRAEGRFVDPQAFRALENQSVQTAGRGAGLHLAWMYLSGLLGLAFAAYVAIHH